jgi:hypothetical protein
VIYFCVVFVVCNVSFVVCVVLFARGVLVCVICVFLFAVLDCSATAIE